MLSLGIYYTLWVRYCEVWLGHMNQCLFCLRWMQQAPAVKLEETSTQTILNGKISFLWVSKVDSLFCLLVASLRSQCFYTRREFVSLSLVASSRKIHNLSNIRQSCYFSVWSLNVLISLFENLFYPCKIKM